MTRCRLPDWLLWILAHKKAAPSQAPLLSLLLLSFSIFSIFFFCSIKGLFHGVCSHCPHKKYSSSHPRFPPVPSSQAPNTWTETCVNGLIRELGRAAYTANVVRTSPEPRALGSFFAHRRVIYLAPRDSDTTSRCRLLDRLL